MGKGFRIKRKFAVLELDYKRYLADTLRGTLYTHTGEHNNDVHICVVDFPDITACPAQEIKNGH